MRIRLLSRSDPDMPIKTYLMKAKIHKAKLIYPSVQGEGAESTGQCLGISR